MAATGLVDGVTTNPSLAAKTGRDYVELLKEICAIVAGRGQRRSAGHRLSTA